MNGVVVVEGGRGLVASAIYAAGDNRGQPKAKAPVQEAEVVSER
jgi:hypothetical protein